MFFFAVDDDEGFFAQFEIKKGSPCQFKSDTPINGSIGIALRHVSPDYAQETIKGLNDAYPFKILNKSEDCVYYQIMPVEGTEWKWFVCIVNLHNENVIDLVFEVLTSDKISKRNQSIASKTNTA